MINKFLMNLQKQCVSFRAEIITNHSQIRIKQKCGLKIGRTKLNQPARHFSTQMPSPKGLPIIGSALSLMKSGGAGKLHVYVDERHKKYGPIFKDKLGNFEGVFISKPEYIRAVFAQEGDYPRHFLPEAWVEYNKLFGTSRGLFFMDSTDWWHFRRIVNKCLLKNLQCNIININNACTLAADLLAKQLSDSKDLEKLLYKWSLNTISGVLIGADNFHANLHKFEDDLIKLANAVYLIFVTTARLQFVPADLAAKLNLKPWQEFVQSVDEALNLTSKLVHSFIREFPKNDGIIGSLLNAGLGKSEVMKIVIDLVIAAGDTTAYTMQWILYNLAKNKHVQEELYNDLEKNENKSFKNFIKETLRLHPIAPFITRIAPNDIKIGSYLIEKETMLVLSLYTSGRDESVFENAHLFNPQRWDNRTPAMLQATLAFAMGRRSCVGKRVADTQLLSTLKTIVSTYELDIQDDDDVEMILQMVAVPSKPIKLKYTKRCK